MIQTKKYLAQGQIGDFIHSICVCKHIYEVYGYKADLYIWDSPNPFYKGLAQTFRELEPVMSRQVWVNSFRIYNGENIDMDLSSFRASRKLFQTNWLELMFDLFLPAITPPREYNWIDMPKDSNFSDCLLINRSTKVPGMSQHVVEKYDHIIQGFERRYFICTDVEQYDAFPLKDKCPMLRVDDLYTFFTLINSCKLYVGNQSGPSAWATSMNVNRIVELRNGVDSTHYIGDVNYYSNFNYFIGD